MSALASLKTVGYKAAWVLKKYAPEILTGVGVVGAVASGTLLVRAGMKTEPILEEHRETVELVKVNAETDKQQQKELTRTYLKTGGSLVKLYGPAIAIGAGSVVAIVSGHGVLRKRNIAHIAAYQALKSTFDEYRQGVIEQLGADKESDIRKGIRTVEEVDEKTGKTKKVKAQTVLPDTYDRVFDSKNPNFQGDPTTNEMFLRQQQNYLNDMLHVKGRLTLNDVYDRLGFERDDTYGMVVGWTSDGSDRFIDFGIQPDEWVDVVQDIIRKDTPHEFRLSFNVDGSIYGA